MPSREVRRELKYLDKVETKFAKKVWYVFSKIFRVISESNNRTKSEFISEVNINTREAITKMEKDLRKLSRKELDNLIEFQYKKIDKLRDATKWTGYTNSKEIELVGNFKSYTEKEVDRILKISNEIVSGESDWKAAEKKIKQEFRKRYNDVDKKEISKARQIVRTELNRYNNETKTEIGKREGAVRKRWVTEGDSAVRDTHQAADGQIRKVGEYFNVGADSMLYPCGGSLAEENVNCRCQVEMIYED